MWRAWILALGCVAAASAQLQVVREGAYWVGTLRGSEPAGSAARLRVTARGAVTVNGAAQSDLSYVLKISVKASSETAARRIIGNSHVKVSLQGSTAVFSASTGSGLASLNLRVPKGLAEVTVVTTEGDVQTVGLDGAVRAQTGGGRILADRIGGDFAANTPGGDIQLGVLEGAAHCITAGGRITVKTIRGAATLETGGGDVSAEEVGGALRVGTGGGGIRVLRAGSTVAASTGGGPIDVGQARGMVSARNSGGPVLVGTAFGVSCENAAGGVRLQNVTGNLRVSTAFGNIVAQLISGRPLGESFLSTSNGDITVVIPSNVGVMIRAQNESAGSMRRIVSEFPGLPVRLQGNLTIAEGPVNGGGPLLRISGTGGTIFIKRQQ